MPNICTHLKGINWDFVLNKDLRLHIQSLLEFTYSFDRFTPDHTTRQNNP